MMIALIKRTLSLAMIPIVLAVMTGTASSQSVPTPTQTPGPYIVPVDYDALYAMDAPPPWIGIARPRNILRVDRWAMQYTEATGNRMMATRKLNSAV